MISTGKYDFQEAENYSTFILKTVISYPLFSYLNLSPKKYWKILLFKDHFNYGGIAENEEVLMNTIQIYIVGSHILFLEYF
jgi:Domain of unknown function (DUF1744).